MIMVWPFWEIITFHDIPNLTSSFNLTYSSEYSLIKMIIIETIAAITGLVFLLALLYLFVLAAASLLPERRIGHHAPGTSFCIVIPAHNEKACIADTIRAARAVEYPGHLFDIVVVADKCNDNTADIAKKMGARVLERNEPGPAGKGFVLKWAFERLLAVCSHDAFVVIDADTWMDRSFLGVMNDCICSGEKAIQAYSQVRHPEKSVFESLSFLGFALNRNLRYRGRSRLGWSANLMGTGMCFSREILERFGWPTTTLVEDVEFTMFLRLHGIRVCFADKARISVELHNSIRGTERQRLRWDLGKLEVRNRYVPLLLKAALTKGELACLDSAVELLFPPFPVFFLMVFGGGALFLPVLWVSGSTGAVCLLWILNVSALMVYTLAGLFSARAPLGVYRALLFAPFVIFWRAWIVFRESLKKKRHRSW